MRRTRIPGCKLWFVSECPTRRVSCIAVIRLCIGPWVEDDMDLDGLAIPVDR